MERPFLTARWENLMLLTWLVPRHWVEPHLPPDCEPDLWEGRCFASLVAFDFLETKVFGRRWPGHVNFPEINLRLYVRRGEQRGVVFVREIVPRRAIAFIARAFYNEPYAAAAIRRTVVEAEEGVTATHLLRWRGRIFSVSMTGRKPAVLAPPDSADHFFKEHQWGFGRNRRGATIVYEVRHPVWQTWPVISHTLDWDFGALYGDPWGALAGTRPDYATFAVGSETAVYPQREEKGT